MAIALWAAAGTHPGALVWITLDGFDNRPRVFWSYVAAALRQAGVDVPRVSPARGQAAASSHGFLLRLASVLAAQDPPVVLVLDDLHRLTAAPRWKSSPTCCGTPGAGLHVVVASRVDPLLPLHRYRLIGELTEIRADDLAFRVPESTSLLSHHGVTLSAHALQSLTGRTEGWAAGVRLAALSLDGHPDPEQFVKELDAEDSAITAYLVEEVLNAQPSAVRDLLLRTSILDCVSTGLAGELVGDPEAGNCWPALARANAFVQPLGHGWYRYHSLFAAVLRLKLRSDCADQVPDLHRRAARWYQRSGWLAEAVRHAAESGDWPFAGHLVFDGARRKPAHWPRGPQPLADGVPPHAAGCGVDAASAPAGAGGPGAVRRGGPGGRRRARDRGSLLGAVFPPRGRPGPAGRGAHPVRRCPAAPGTLGAAEAAAAERRRPCSERCRRACCARHPGIRAQVLLARGAAELRAGLLDETAATFGAAVAAAADPDTAYERADGLGHLALVEVLRGRLSRAVELAGDAATAAQNGGDGLAEHVTAAVSVALAAVYLERNELRQAHGQLKQADAALRVSPDKLVNAVACKVAARCRLAEGHPAAATELIGRARQGWSPPGWLEQRLTFLESRAYAAEGDTQAALAAAGRIGPPSTNGTAVALAQVWLAAGDHQAARRALDAGAEGSRAAPEQVRLEGSLVDARLHYGTGDAARGRQALEHALRLGRPEQLRLSFALEQAWIRRVLRCDPDLAHACRPMLGPGLVSPAVAPARPAVDAQGAPLIVERLSEREQEVLRHLSRMLSTAEIAAEMYISVNTVKTHLRSIYRKLSASRRSEAVRRARELDLI